MFRKVSIKYSVPASKVVAEVIVLFAGLFENCVLNTETINWYCVAGESPTTVKKLLVPEKVLINDALGPATKRT